MTRPRLSFVALLLAVLALATPTVSAAPPLGICLPCTVVTVHDGDTASEVEVTIRCSVRYDGCWAPELNQPGGQSAAASAKQAEGKSGRLFIPLNNVSNLSQLFTFGRVVGSIYLDGDEQSQSELQVQRKHAATKKGGTLGR